MEKKYLSVRELTELLGCSRFPVYRKLKTGAIRGFKPKGFRLWRIPVEEVKRLLNEEEEKEEVK
jgi:excisionase family DNA binding protein